MINFLCVYFGYAPYISYTLWLSLINLGIGYSAKLKLGNLYSGSNGLRGVRDV